MVPPPFVRAPFSLHRYMGLQESKKQRQPILTMSLCDPSCAENTPTNSNTVVMANTSRGVLKVRFVSLDRSPVDRILTRLRRSPRPSFSSGLSLAPPIFSSPWRTRLLEQRARLGYRRALGGLCDGSRRFRMRPR